MNPEADHAVRRQAETTGRLRTALAVAASLFASASVAYQAATNGYLTVKANDDTSPTGGAGLFTVETGAIHPTPGKSIFYNSAANLIGTSFITVIDTDAKIMWVNAESSTTMTPTESGYTVQRMQNQPTSIAPLGSKGFRTTYALPSFTVIQDTVIIGSTLMDTSVMHKVTITNTSGSEVHYGVRYLWDWMVAAIDSSYFKQLEPDGSFTNVFALFDQPGFSRYEASDSATFPSFQIYGTTHGGNLADAPRQPDQLRYASWSDARRYPWDFTVAGGGIDSAIVYYWGFPAPLSLTPGSSTTFTQYVTANLYALRRAIPQVSVGLSTTGIVCAGDAVTYTVSFSNRGDATSMNLTFTDTVPTAMEFLAGTTKFWAGSRGPTQPVLVSRAWATALGGTWTEGDPPTPWTPPHFLRWVVDWLGPAQSGYIQFVMNAPRGIAPGQTLITQASATNALDSTVFTSQDVRNSTNEAQIRKTVDPGAVDAGGAVRYSMSAWCPCATTIYNVTLFDTVPDGMDLIGVSPGGTLSGTRFVSWSLGNIEPGMQRDVYYDATANGSHTLVRNLAELDYSSNRNGTLEGQPHVNWFKDLDVQIPKFTYYKRAKDTDPPQFPAAPDGKVIFEIAITNDRNVTLTNVTLWDSLPPAMDYDSDTAGGTVSGKLVWWNVPNIYPGTRWRVDLTVQLSGSCYTLGPNTAWLGFDPVTDPYVPHPPASSGDAYVDLAQPILWTEHTPNPEYVPPGELITYTIAVHNDGKARASSIYLWDTLPDHSSFVDAKPGYTIVPGSPDMITWDLPDIPAGSSDSVWYTMRADTSDAGLQSLRGGLNYTGVAGCSTFETSIRDMYVNKAQPVISMFKYVDQGTVPVGGLATWTFTLTNSGRDSALNIIVADEIPYGLEFAGCTGPPGWTCTKSGVYVTWATGMIPVGQTLALSFTTTVTGPTVPPCVTNDGNNYGQVGWDNRVARRWGADSTWACLRTGDADLYLEKIPNYNPVTQDSPLTWWFTMSNTGSLAASNITLWDSLPAGAEYLGCGGCSCWESSGLVVWRPADLAAGERTQMYVSVTARAGMSCTNFGEASFDNPIGLARPRSIGVGPCVPVVLPVLEVSKRPVRPIYANGEAVMYILSYTNVGTGIANKVRLTDVVSANMSFVDATISSSGDPWSTALAGSNVEVIWDLGSVSPGQAGSATVTLLPRVLSATACESGSFWNSANIKYEKESGVWLFADSGPVGVQVNDTALRIDLTASPPIADPGQQVMYTLAVQNVCDGTVTALSVWDSLPAGAGFAGSTGGGVFTPGLISWSVPTVLPRTSTTLTFTVSVQGAGPWIGPDTAEGAFSNGAGLNQPRVLSNTVWVGVSTPVLTMTKTASPDPVADGGTLRYQLDVRNVSLIRAVGIGIIDTLPAGVLFQSCQGGSSCWWDGTRVNWTLPEMPPGASTVLTVATTASGPATCPAVNVARADYSLEGATWRQNIASNAVCVVVVHSALTLDIKADRPVHVAGEPVSYSIVCANTGTDTAQALVVSDTLPAGAVFWSATPGGAPAPGGRAWPVPALAPGASATIWVTLVTTAAGCTAYSLPHNAFAHYSNSSGIAQAPLGPVTATVTVTGAALTLSLSPSSTMVLAGRAVTYVVAWANPCSDTAWNVSLWDTVPPGALWAGGDGSLSGGIVSWTLGNAPPGSSGAVTFSVSWVGESQTDYLPAATARFRDSGGVAALAVSAPGSVTLLNPDVDVVKTGPAGTVSDGKAHYDLLIRNTGTDTAWNLVVVDTMPLPLGFVSSVPPAFVAAGVVSWSFTSLGIGQNLRLSIETQAPAGWTDEASPENCALATFLTTLELPRSSPRSCWTFRLSPSLTIRVFPNPFEPGKAVRGTMKFTGLPNGSVVSLYTLTGVRMRSLSEVRHHAIEWDGRNSSGSPVAAGMYLYVIEVPDEKGGTRRLKGKFGLIR